MSTQKYHLSDTPAFAFEEHQSVDDLVARQQNKSGEILARMEQIAAGLRVDVGHAGIKTPHPTQKKEKFNGVNIEK